MTRTEEMRALAQKIRDTGRTQKVVKSAKVLEAAAGLERFRRYLRR